jgi:hypothetical protein
MKRSEIRVWPHYRRRANCYAFGLNSLYQRMNSSLTHFALERNSMAA